MRFICVVLVLLTILSYLVVTGFTVAPPARNMMATIYDDGKSCPNGCDAHVVFHPRNNGTRNAFAPEGSRSAPQKCIVGQPCKICFSESESSCLIAIYRGNGPAIERFDFTPAFYEENCPKPGLPTVFADKCREAAPGVARFQGQFNCILDPDNAKCNPLMSTVKQRKATDDVLYDECKQLGERAFNIKYSGQPKKQRTNDCAYEMLRSGRNSHGQTWHKLLDGACRTGNYAGRDGTDCCTGNLYAAALLVSECKMFFVPR